MSLSPKRKKIELDKLRDLLLEYLPALEKFKDDFRLVCSAQRENCSYRYEYKITGESVVTCGVRCSRKVCSQFISVPSQSTDRQNFQKEISGKTLKQTTKWIISLTNEKTCFDNDKLESALQNHVCKHNTRSHVDSSNADGGGISENMVEHSRASDVNDAMDQDNHDAMDEDNPSGAGVEPDEGVVGQKDVCANIRVVVTSEVLAYNDNDYDNDNDNDNN